MYCNQNSTFNRENVKFELDCFDHIIELIPDGLQILEEIHAVKDGIQLFTKFMHKKASASHSDDTKALKKDIARYLLYNPANNIIMPLLPISDGKYGTSTTRGFNHLACAQSLCPRCLLDEFDIDPKTFMENVRNGVIKFKERDFPAFLYDQSIPYDPDNKDAGLLKGHALIQTYRHIITGPKTALNPNLIKAKNSRCKSEKIVLTRSDPYTVYYSLAAADNWGSVLSNGYSLQDLYNWIVQFLDDEEDPVVQDVLEWYNRECHFDKLKHRVATKESETEMDTGDELEEIHMMRLQCCQNVNQSNMPPSSNASNDHDERCPIDPELFQGSTGNVDDHEEEEEIYGMDSMALYPDGQVTDLLSTRQTSPTNIPMKPNNAGNFSGSIIPNNFIHFNSNGNTFLIPDSIDNLQALNSITPNGFRIQGLNPNRHAFYISNGNIQWNSMNIMMSVAILLMRNCHAQINAACKPDQAQAEEGMC
ncbi:hypothetical protein APHAL10511_006623 [Amanita phalloides]|nr:hypothetical protein APHAL10511_006623 [Amanita phalloides]